MTARFHELAAWELTEAIAYYDTKTEGLGDQLLAEVRAAVGYIEEFPESSPVIDHSVRRKVLAKFPYDLFYALAKSSSHSVRRAREPPTWFLARPHPVTHRRR